MGLFSVSDKTRQKILTKANEVLGTPQHDVVVAQRKFAMTPGAWALAAVVVFAMVAAVVVLEVIPIPGVVIIILFGSMTMPRRTVAFGPGGYTNLAASIWTSKPNKVIATVPNIQFATDNAVTIGEERMTMSSKEMGRLRSWIQPAASPPPGAPPFASSALGAQGFHQPAPAPQQGYPQPAPAPQQGYPQPAPAPQQGYPQPAPAPQQGYPQQVPGQRPYGQPTDLPPPPPQ